MTVLKAVANDRASFADRLLPQSAIEQGRANALDSLIDGEPLQLVLTKLVSTLESSTQDLKCSILLVNKDKKTLSPLVAPSLPDTFVESLYNFPIGPEEACCGAAVYSKQPVITSNIHRHPNWARYQDLLAEVDFVSCWSCPVISPDDEVLGTFSAYYSDEVEPSEEDLDALRYEAKIVALILERANNIEKLKRANSSLEQRVEERTQALTEANVLLKKALEQRNEVRTQLVEMENMAALGTMMSSLTHEINTPVGVAITAISHLRTVQALSREQFDKGALKRSDLEKFYAECDESCDIIERNLVRSTELIKTFKQLSIDQHSQDARRVNLSGYVDEILLSLKPRLKRAKHMFCIDIAPDLEIISNPGAISQLLINLILNSAKHGFEADERGRITIRARQFNTGGIPHLELLYKDNGKGMSKHTVENLYKPFFTQARSSGGSGLGMHICYNIVVKVLEGSIDCESEPGKGVTFAIVFPLGETG